MLSIRIKNALWMLGTLMAISLTTPITTQAEDQTLTIAAVQYPIEGNKTVPEILNKVEVFLNDATTKQANLLVLPELITLDAWPTQQSTEETIETERLVVQDIAQNITPTYFEGIRQLAKKHHLAIMAGSSPVIDPTSKQLTNVALLVLPDGKEFTQTKIHPTKWERDIGITPGHTITIADCPWGKTAILVCYDVEFPDLSITLIEASPLLLLVPSMTESQAGLKRVRWTAQSRAIEHHAIVVISGTVGQPTPTWHHFGQAAILGPASETFEMNDTQGTPNTPNIITQTINLNTLSTSRQHSHFHPAKDKREKPTSN